MNEILSEFVHVILNQLPDIAITVAKTSTQLKDLTVIK